MPKKPNLTGETTIAELAALGGEARAKALFWEAALGDRPESSRRALGKGQEGKEECLIIKRFRFFTVPSR